MPVDKDQVVKNFRRSAGTYDEYAVFQKAAAFALMGRIKNSGKSYRNILEIGCGTGFLTGLLAEEYPQALILATDIVPEMIAVAESKLARFQNVTFRLADGENAELAVCNTFDLIASSMVFQWFDDYLLPFSRYYHALTNEGCLIFSTLGEGTFNELYSCLDKSHVYTGNETVLHKKKLFINKDVLTDTMRQAGFTDVATTDSVQQEFYASSRDFLRTLKKTGANSYLRSDLEKTQGTGMKIFNLIKDYDSRFRSHQGVVASYHCLHGYGRKQWGDGQANNKKAATVAAQAGR